MKVLGKYLWRVFITDGRAFLTTGHSFNNEISRDALSRWVFYEPITRGKEA